MACGTVVCFDAYLMSGLRSSIAYSFIFWYGAKMVTTSSPSITSTWNAKSIDKFPKSRGGSNKICRKVAIFSTFSKISPGTRSHRVIFSISVYCSWHAPSSSLLCLYCCINAPARRARHERGGSSRVGCTKAGTKRIVKKTLVLHDFRAEPSRWLGNNTSLQRERAGGMLATHQLFAIIRGALIPQTVESLIWGFVCANTHVACYPPYSSRRA